MVNVFGQVPEFQKGQSAEFLRVIKTLSTLSHRKFFYLHYVVIELFIESESPYTMLNHYSSNRYWTGFVEFCYWLWLNSCLMVKLSNKIYYGTNTLIKYLKNINCISQLK